jgi:hypothetical protein
MMKYRRTLACTYAHVTRSGWWNCLQLHTWIVWSTIEAIDSAHVEDSIVSFQAYLHACAAWCAYKASFHACIPCVHALLTLHSMHASTSTLWRSMEIILATCFLNMPAWFTTLQRNWPYSSHTYNEQIVLSYSISPVSHKMHIFMNSCIIR